MCPLTWPHTYPGRLCLCILWLPCGQPRWAFGQLVNWCFLFFLCRFYAKLVRQLMRLAISLMQQQAKRSSKSLKWLHSNVRLGIRIKRGCQLKLTAINVIKIGKYLPGCVSESIWNSFLKSFPMQTNSKHNRTQGPNHNRLIFAIAPSFRCRKEAFFLLQHFPNLIQHFSIKNQLKNKVKPKSYTYVT